jgi:tripartite-type tricarboxylate transporter receptor subunit TctC
MRLCRFAVMIGMLAAVSIAATQSARSQPAAAPFPIGKPVYIYAGLGVGGTNDAVMRLVGRHIGKYLPGTPTVIPRNMTGAGGRRLGSYMYNVAARDGTEFGTNQRSNVTDVILVDATPAFKNEEMTWLGSPSDATDICLVWHTARVQSIADTKNHELILASTGPAESQAHILRRLTGGKIRSVQGYESGVQAHLAIERGEADGRCALSWEALKSQYPAWLNGNKVNVIVQFNYQRHPELPNVPLIGEFATTDIDKQAMNLILLPQAFGFPFFAPPGLLPEVRDMLRKAFDQTMQDPGFLEEAKRTNMHLAPVSGAKLQDLIQRVYSSNSPEVLARAKLLMSP